MIGTSVFDFLDDETRARRWRRCCGSRSLETVVDRSATRSSSGTGTATDVWTRCSATPILDVDGGLEGVVSLVTDITEQREVEEQLRYNEARLTTLFEVSSDIMAILEPNGTGTPAPPGRASSAIRSAGIPTAASSPSSTRTMSSMAGIAPRRGARRHPRKHEPIRVRLRHIDGHYLWFDCTAENQIDNPTVRGLIIIARDVTDQKIAEDAQVEAETGSGPRSNAHRSASP